MTIYLACTVRGDRESVAGLRTLVTALEESGHAVLTKHLLEDDADAAEAGLTERSVYERDIQWLEACDILIAEASGSSYGVGFEVGYVLGRAAATTQRVILLYRGDRRTRISRLICGNAHPRCAHVEYESPSELPTRVLRTLSPKP